MSEVIRTYTWMGKTLPMSCPDVSDEDVAARVRMLHRNDLDHELICTLARDRIMAMSKELTALQSRVDGHVEHIKSLEAEVAELRAIKFRRFANQDCWIYQGDGEDHLESLVCPVVVSPHKMIELESAQSRVAELEAENKLLDLRVKYLVASINNSRSICHWSEPRFSHECVAIQDGDSASCRICEKDMGWFCPSNPTKCCEYSDENEYDECCIHCKQPSERK